MSRIDPLAAADAIDPARGLAAAHAIALLRGERPAPLAPLLQQATRAPAPLLRIIQRFALPPLAVDLLALVAAPELGLAAATALAAHPLAIDGRATPALCAELLGADATPALAPGATLRAGALIAAPQGPGFAGRPLQIPEAVVAALHGAPAPDWRLASALQPCPTCPTAVADSAAGAQLADALRRARAQHPGHWAPILHLDTDDPAAAIAVAGAAARRLGLGLALLEPALLPETADPGAVLRALGRDAILLETAILLPASRDGCLLADRLHGPFLLWGKAPPRTARPLASLTIARPAALPLSAARDAQAAHDVGFAADLPTLLRQRAASHLDDLAQRIEPQASWADLVLPPAQLAQLQQLASYYRHRARVLDDWGFRAKSRRGLALAALFSGPSGTGKTMAAEILARALSDDGGALALYRVDLAALVSKYIGETQKNIGRVFDIAERSGAMLLFDEGEAIFSRRSREVKDSNDRHANAETSYLLQRLENYSGVAIVTTNLRATVDDAFLRRFRAVIEFPFPDAGQRARIWRSVLPEALPREGIDYDVLARLAISGGFIRAIALSAAWLAAEAGGPLTMRHLKQAARQEYGKLGKTLAEAELRGFQ